MSGRPDHRRVDRLRQLAHRRADHRRPGPDRRDGVFWKILPESRNFRASSLKPRSLVDGFVMHFKDAGLPWLFLEAFLLMGAFVTMFNYIGYRLLAAPYDLSQAVVGLLSLVYLSGIYSSAKNRRAGPTASAAAVCCGPPSCSMLGGIGLTLFTPLWLVIPGMLVFTFGFFGAHSVASSWIGRRAVKAKGQASSLYLFCYYAGSSVAGTTGGVLLAFGRVERGIGGFIVALLLGGVAGGVEVGEVAAAGLRLRRSALERHPHHHPLAPALVHNHGTDVHHQHQQQGHAGQHMHAGVPDDAGRVTVKRCEGDQVKEVDRAIHHQYPCCQAPLPTPHTWPYAPIAPGIPVVNA